MNLKIAFYNYMYFVFLDETPDPYLARIFASFTKTSTNLVFRNGVTVSSVNFLAPLCAQNWNGNFSEDGAPSSIRWSMAPSLRKIGNQLIRQSEYRIQINEVNKNISAGTPL